MTWKEIFLGNIAGSPPTGKILTSFPVSDGSIKFASTFEYRRSLYKVGEGKSHRLAANELRKEDGHKDRFSPISERTNSFTEIKTDF